MPRGPLDTHLVMTTLPGLIDVHVHLREPGATHKEDFSSGSKAALAGGFTFVLDMPNNPAPTVSIESLQQKIQLADGKAVCDIGFNYGTDGNNLNTFIEASSNPRVFGLKIYCNHTTGNLLVNDPQILDAIFAAWKSEKPILAHAEGEQLALVINLAKKHERRLHVCHISRSEEVDMVRKAKAAGQTLTSGVTPHHLFLTDIDAQKLGPFGIVKPYITSKTDQDALWEGIMDNTIDLVESDHAPHTREEKLGTPPPFGMPGLETTLGLLGKAAHQGKLSVSDITRLLHDASKQIFNIPDQPDTHIEVDFDESYVLDAKNFYTKAQWSPFEDWELYGRIKTVVVRGREIIRDNKLLE